MPSKLIKYRLFYTIFKVGDETGLAENYHKIEWNQQEANQMLYERNTRYLKFVTDQKHNYLGIDNHMEDK